MIQNLKQPRGITCEIDADQAPPAWRASEGPGGQAAADVGGGVAWPGFETTRRAKLAARTARGRAAAHGRTKQPGPTAGSDGARNTSGATQQHSQKSYEKYESFIGSS